MRGTVDRGVDGTSCDVALACGDVALVGGVAGTSCDVGPVCDVGWP